MANGDRYASRKWILVNKMIWVYTGVHILSAMVLIGLLYFDELKRPEFVELLKLSITVWSVGLLTWGGWYMKKNVDEKSITNGGGK